MHTNKQPIEAYLDDRLKLVQDYCKRRRNHDGAIGQNYHGRLRFLTELDAQLNIHGTTGHHAIKQARNLARRGHMSQADLLEGIEAEAKFAHKQIN